MAHGPAENKWPATLLLWAEKKQPSVGQISPLASLNSLPDATNIARPCSPSQRIRFGAIKCNNIIERALVSLACRTFSGRKFLKEGDDITAVPRVLYAARRHKRSGDKRTRVAKPFLKRFVVPDDAGRLDNLRVTAETLDGPGFFAPDPRETGSGLVHVRLS